MNLNSSPTADRPSSVRRHKNALSRETARTKFPDAFENLAWQLPDYFHHPDHLIAFHKSINGYLHITMLSTDPGPFNIDSARWYDEFKVWIRASIGIRVKPYVRDDGTLNVRNVSDVSAITEMPPRDP